jgi:hypothetical protein
MKVSLKSIGILKAALMTAAMYVFVGVIEALFMGLFFLFGSKPNAGAMGFGAVFIFIFPVMFGVMGFLAGALLAACYNVMARLTGGMEFEFEKLPEAMSPSASISPPIA